VNGASDQENQPAVAREKVRRGRKKSGLYTYKLVFRSFMDTSESEKARGSLASVSENDRYGFGMIVGLMGVKSGNSKDG
jgi:hypothetical protein